MDQLGGEAFASTQENAQAGGGGNTNPRMALREQPAVRLSREGLEWLNVRFDAALREHGRVPEEDLASLDWPAVGWPTFAEVLAAHGLRAQYLWKQVRQEAVARPDIVSDISSLAAYIGLQDPNDAAFRLSVGHFSQGHGAGGNDRPLHEFRASLVLADDPHANPGTSSHQVR